jgi:Leucine rich repeat
MLFFAITLLFFGLCNGIILDCTYKTAFWSQPQGTIYYCDAKVIRFNNDRFVTGVSQNHLSGKSDSDVKAIGFYNQPMDFVPQNISTYFPNIQGFAVSSTSLKVVSKIDFEQFPDLIDTFLNNDELETIDGDLFASNPKLQYISLISNKITNVGPNLLSSLKELRVVYFSNNICINFYATNSTGVLDVARRLAHACPPTADMIERIIVNGENFVEMTEDIEEVQSKTRRLENRVAELENIIMDMDALSAANSAKVEQLEAITIEMNAKCEAKIDAKFAEFANSLKPTQLFSDEKKIK